MLCSDWGNLLLWQSKVKKKKWSAYESFHISPVTQFDEHRVELQQCEFPLTACCLIHFLPVCLICHCSCQSSFFITKLFTGGHTCVTVLCVVCREWLWKKGWVVYCVNCERLPKDLCVELHLSSLINSLMVLTTQYVLQIYFSSKCAIMCNLWQFCYFNTK